MDSRSGGSDARCTFFESTTWDERIERHVGRVWDLETALRKTITGDITQRIDTIAARLDTDPESLAVTPVGEVLTMGGADQLELSLSQLATVWRDEHSWLPSTCPHDAVQQEDRCCFHLSPEETAAAGITRRDVTDAMVDALDPDTGRESCFVGAQLAVLDLSGVFISQSDTRPIDFRLATIENSVTCADATIGPPLTLLGAELCSEESTDTTTGEAANRYVSVDGDIDFSGTTFKNSVDCKYVQFDSSVTFNGAKFRDIAMFNSAVFADQVELWATVEGKADFTRATIQGTAQLRGTYKTAAIFNYTTFESDVILWNSTFGGKVECLATEFCGPVDAAHPSFQGVVRFCETTCHEPVTLRSATFDEIVRFRRLQAPTTVIDLRKATLTAGVVEQSTPPAYFDLANATVGAVELTVADGVSLPENPLAYLHINRTAFDGFDFSAHSHVLKPTWQLDGLTEEWPGTVAGADLDRVEQYAQREETYLRAKSGATDAGHNKAASEFFVHEMRSRRKQHAATVRQRWAALRTEAEIVPWVVYAPVVGTARSIGDLVRQLSPTRTRQPTSTTPAWLAGYRWVSNGTLGLITGYGERPQRPILASVGTIFLFAGGYRLLGVTPPVEGRLGVGYLLLSLQSFITFILGASPVDAGFGPQIMSAVEGFLGAFLIAVFVFALTRSIHR
ncbi:hypothetical protein [Halorubrum sp. AS12]|uniref:hypothetical protein n=1 Tax=Halorubrum sp. AS12 TaxID=3409687 RepID=UPI003DA73926